MNIFLFPVALWKVKKEIGRQKTFNQKFLGPYIKELEEKYGGRFEEPQLKKINHYYGLFIPSVLCASYKRLYHTTLSDDERKRASLFGILTPVGDDLFDIDHLDIESIRQITFDPHHYKAHSFSGKVAKEIQAFLIDTVPNKEAYLKASKNVFEIQLETIRQTKPDITDEDIEKITDAKGGYSVIIYHQILAEEADENMLNALFKIGALMQFANDCFDVYKDIHDGIYTLVSRCSDYRILKQKYLAKVKDANAAIRQLPYSDADKSTFMIIMHVIISQGLVAIDQLIRLQDKTGGPVDCLSQPRKNLITDMQKIPNVFRWMYYATTLPFK